MTEPKQRSQQQNRALHMWLTQVSETLNDAGLDIKAILAGNAVEIPWTPTSAKELLWKPVQEVMIGEDSTAKANTRDYNAVYETLTKHLAENLGVELPRWPDRFAFSDEPPVDSE